MNVPLQIEGQGGCFPIQRIEPDAFLLLSPATLRGEYRRHFRRFTRPDHPLIDLGFGTAAPRTDIFECEGQIPLVTDGETIGHHRRLRDLSKIVHRLIAHQANPLHGASYAWKPQQQQKRK